jgi:hypothetical protein
MTDTVAVITGAARGLGKSFSEALLKRGYKVRLYYVEIVYIFWPLCCLFDMRILITPLVSFGHCVVCSICGFWLPLWYLLAIVLSVRYTDSDYPFGIFWPLCCLFDIRILITPLVSFGHCVVCSIYGFWLPLWYLQALLIGEETGVPDKTTYLSLFTDTLSHDVV